MRARRPIFVLLAAIGGHGTSSTVGAVETAGDHVAVAGLGVRLWGDAGRRGRPVYALGTSTAMGPLKRVPVVRFPFGRPRSRRGPP